MEEEDGCQSKIEETERRAEEKGDSASQEVDNFAFAEETRHILNRQLVKRYTVQADQLTLVRTSMVVLGLQAG